MNLIDKHQRVLPDDVSVATLGRSAPATCWAWTTSEMASTVWPPTDGLRFTLPDARVIIRPSGTEPKLKGYLQVVVPVHGDHFTARAAARSEFDALRTSLAEALDL